MEQLFNRVKASESSKSIWRSDHDSIQFKAASKVNKILNGIPLNKAPRCECLEDLFFQLKRMNVKQKINIMESKQFYLKDVMIMSHNCKAVTKDSSDADLIAVLKVSESHIKHFEKYPENWREICGLDKESEAVEGGPVNEEVEEDSTVSRIEVLEAMKNAELKEILLSMADELPTKPTKKNLIDAIIETEKI